MEQTDNKRRNFMLALGLGGIGAAAAVITGKQPAAAETEAAMANAPQARKSYHLSEHVQAYYRTTRI